MCVFDWKNYISLSGVLCLSNECICSSISSTLMDMESTASSGRSTPALLNGHGGGVPMGSVSTGAGGKSLSYTCCWDHCQQQFPSSPDLAEHIRTTHVDGQRGGVSVPIGHPIHRSKAMPYDRVCVFSGVCVSVERL